MVRRFVSLLLGLLLWAVPCFGAEASSSDLDFTGRIDLPRLRSYTLANNPEIQVMQQRWRAAQARPSQEGSLPDPMINTAYHNESFDRLSQGSSEFSFLRFGAEQELPFPGKLGLKETVATREADREGALYRATVLNVASRLRVAYNDYFLAYKSIEIVRRNKVLLEKFEKTAEAKYQVGQGIQQDVLKAQVEISILINRLTSLEQKRQSAIAALNALLNRPPLDPLGDPAAVEKSPFPYRLDELAQRAGEGSPLLQAVASTVMRQESNLDLAKRQYYPDFVARADYFNKAALVPEWEVGVGIRVPLYFWRKRSFGVQEAAASLNEARAARQSTSQEILARVKDLYAQATAADQLVSLYSTRVLRGPVSLNRSV